MLHKLFMPQLPQAFDKTDKTSIGHKEEWLKTMNSSPRQYF